MNPENENNPKNNNPYAICRLELIMNAYTNAICQPKNPIPQKKLLNSLKYCINPFNIF
jgi:hypothetical protein